jgi:hypothetical protein
MQQIGVQSCWLLVDTKAAVIVCSQHRALRVRFAFHNNAIGISVAIAAAYISEACH